MVGVAPGSLGTGAAKRGLAGLLLALRTFDGATDVCSAHDGCACFEAGRLTLSSLGDEAQLSSGRTLASLVSSSQWGR